MNKKYINFSLEILLVFSIILFVLSIFVRTVALNKNTYLNILNSNNAYSDIKQTIYTKMDKALGSNINNNIKESIITEDDIKMETDNLITNFLEYLKTGKNTIEPISTQKYEQRVEEVINKIINNSVNAPINVKPQNTVLENKKLQFNNMVIVKEKSENGQDSFSTEKLMTASEAEEKIQSILKQKGLTEAQARQKMAEKGITEEQALKILESYGVEIDNQPSLGGDGNSSNNNSSVEITNNQNSVSKKNNINESQIVSGIEKSQSQNSNNDITSNEVNSTDNTNIGTTNNNAEQSLVSKLHKDIIDEMSTNDGKSIEEKLNNIESKVFNEVSNKINNELEKISINRLIESSKLQQLAQITSLFYKMFWLFMILPIILISILVKVKRNDFSSILKWVGSGFVLTGLFILVIFSYAYISKFYENINVNIVYFKDIILATMEYLLRTILASGIITSAIGLILFIPTIKGNLISKAGKRLLKIS